MNKERFIALSGIVLVLAVARLLPHPANVSPIAAMALFAGTFFEKRWLAFAVPLTAMLASDMVLGFHNTLLAVYLGFSVIVCLGFWLKNHLNTLSIAGSTIAGSVLFFVISNLGVWFAGELYPLTIEGLSTCFVAAVPFFSHTLLGDIWYAALLFGGFMMAERRYHWLALPTSRTA